MSSFKNECDLNQVKEEKFLLSWKVNSNSNDVSEQL